MRVINVHRDGSILAAFAAGNGAAGSGPLHVDLQRGYRATFIDTESLH
jgi:hypothetical protein